jgi:DNA-binding NarL/FixJ family response regulator
LGSHDDPAADLISAGQAALATGEWATARTAFGAALEREESAAALEGFAAASWWLRDDVTTIDARRRAFRSYVDDDDRVAAARVAGALSWDHIFKGERSVAAGWIARGESLLAGHDPVEELGWLIIVKAHLALMADRDATSSYELAQQATELGRALGNRDVQMLALAYEGFALVSAGQIEEGMRKLDESSTAAMSGELDGVNSTATVACCLIYACERVRDFGRAAEWCGRLKEFCERWSFDLMIAICRTHYASTLVSAGAWADAEEELQRAIDEFGLTHPGQAAEALVRLADLRIRQGRLDDATELLDRVESGPARMMGHKIALAARAALHLALGDPEAAVELGDRFLRSLPDAGSMERAPGLEVLVRARAELGNEDGARDALAGLRHLADSVKTPTMFASSLLAQGVILEAFGDPAAARAVLEDAVDLFEEVGIPYDSIQARLSLAGALARGGDVEAARSKARGALDDARSLGASMLARKAQLILSDLGDGEDPGDPRFPGLTTRESEILRLMAQGLDNRGIAERLVLSVRTVERHISNIYMKLGIEGSSARAAATAAAHRAGIV